MEKQSYETYEYLPASGSSTEAEPYQFFVVQDDGTFLINRQVQYLTQVQDVKEPLEGEQSCTMLDVAPQQFYVDIDSTTEMNVPEQFNIPEGTSTLYASSYLLQPGTTPINQIDNIVIEQPKPSIQADNGLPEPNKQAHSLTEITLTDEQYQMLEQKGWILLETNEKVYVLDTYGLHDITTNDKLIQKLKMEETTTNNEQEPGQLKIEFASALRDMDVDIPKVHDDLKVTNPPAPECIESVVFIDDENEEQDTDKQTQWNDKEVSANTEPFEAPQLDNLDREVCDNWKDENVLRIRTDFCLKDIPDKIILGKTKNGKRLVCKVIKPDKKIVKQTETGIDPGSTAEAIEKSILTGLADTGDEKLDAIFRKCFEESSANYTTDDVTFAGKVIKELLRLPAVKPSIVKRNILVTKVSVMEAGSRMVESPPTLVTGAVQSFNEQWRFVYKPEMYAIAKNELTLGAPEDGIDHEYHDFLHMHIHEIQQEGKFVRTAVTLNKRHLAASGSRHPEKIFIPDLPLNGTPESPAPDPVYSMYGYACGTCAAIFPSEKEFEIHIETHKINSADEPGTEDPKFNKSGILVLSDPFVKGKTYSCMQCNAKFQRLNNCQRHVKTHILPAKALDFKPSYKCKICHSLFHHAPTLLKHIMKNHIKVQK